MPSFRNVSRLGRAMLWQDRRDESLRHSLGWDGWRCRDGSAPPEVSLISGCKRCRLAHSCRCPWEIQVVRLQQVPEPCRRRVPIRQRHRRHALVRGIIAWVRIRGLVRHLQRQLLAVSHPVYIAIRLSATSVSALGVLLELQDRTPVTLGGAQERAWYAASHAGRSPTGKHV